MDFAGLLATPPTWIGLGVGVVSAIIVTTALQLLLRRGTRPLGPAFSVPILGDSLAITLTDPARFLFSRYKKYGNVVRLNLLGNFLYAVTDTEAMRGPYLRDDGGYPVIPFKAWDLVMGDYNVLGTKHVHGPWRKTLIPTLGPQGIQYLFPRVLKVIQAHLTRWEADGKIEVFLDTRRLGLDLSVDAVMDVRLSDKIDREWFKEQAETWLQGVFSLPVRLPDNKLSRALAAKKRLVKVLMQEEEEAHKDAIKKWAETGEDIVAVADELSAESESNLPRFLDLQRLSFFGLGRRELEDSAMSVLQGIMAAADTTRWSLFNTMTLVAMSSRVQDKLVEELKQVAAEHGLELTLKAVNSLRYMEATVKESLRLIPPSAGGMRRLTADLKVGDVVIPAGSTTILYSTLLHCVDPVLWDGDKSVEVPAHMDWRNNFEGAFQPERWLSEETRPKHFLTFGTGLHLCAGQNVAIMEIKTTLATVLRKHRLQLQTPDMLARSRLFPYIVPAKGTDTVLLIPRPEPVPAAA